MSADNVIPMPPSGQPPKSKRRKGAHIGLKFADGSDQGPNTLSVYQGLRGVCNALDTAGGSTREIDLYVDLSAAAAVLVSILEDRLL